MTEAEYKLALPCPFCGSENIIGNEWVVDDDHAGKFGADEFSEVWAFECSDCLAGAPTLSWNTRHSPTLETTIDWYYPKNADDVEKMPSPGQRVLMYYQGDNGPTGPTLATPIHADGSHLIDGESIYAPIICWHALPDGPLNI